MTPGMTPPLESLTVPVTAPVPADCAGNEGVNAIDTVINSRMQTENRTDLIDSPPRHARDVIGFSDGRSCCCRRCYVRRSIKSRLRAGNHKRHTRVAEIMCVWCLLWFRGSFLRLP